MRALVLLALVLHAFARYPPYSVKTNRTYVYQWFTQYSYVDEPDFGPPCAEAATPEECATLCDAMPGCFTFSFYDDFGSVFKDCTLHGAFRRVQE